MATANFIGGVPAPLSTDPPDIADIRTIAQKIADFSSTASGLGASKVGVYDAGGNLTATTVEAALAELSVGTLVNATMAANVSGNVKSYKFKNFVVITGYVVPTTGFTNTEATPFATLGITLARHAVFLAYDTVLFKGKQMMVHSDGTLYQRNDGVVISINDTLNIMAVLPLI